VSSGHTLPMIPSPYDTPSLWHTLPLPFVLGAVIEVQAYRYGMACLFHCLLVNARDTTPSHPCFPPPPCAARFCAPSPCRRTSGRPGKVSQQTNAQGSFCCRPVAAKSLRLAAFRPLACRGVPLGVPRAPLPPSVCTKCNYCAAFPQAAFNKLRALLCCWLLLWAVAPSLPLQCGPHWGSDLASAGDIRGASHGPRPGGCQAGGLR